MGKYEEGFMIQPDIKCSECGNYVPASEIQGTKKKPLCKLCDDDNFICDECKKITSNDDLQETIDDRKLCDSCYEDTYSGCDYCEDYFKTEDMTHGVCQECFDENFRECEHCNEYFDNEDMASDDCITVCQDCYDDNYFTCYNCDGIFSNDDREGYDGDSYCTDCYDEIEQDEEDCEDCSGENYSMDDGRIIHSYGFKPYPKFKKTPREKESKLFYGIELEVNEGGSNDVNARKVKKLSDDIYLKHDGTICTGFEIVSHPCTYNYHLKKLPWKKIMKKCESMKYVSHKGRSCGMHIHVSKLWFGDKDNVERDEKLTNLLMLVNWNLWDEVFKFSRRTSNTIRWGKRYTNLTQPMGLLNEGKCGYRGSVNIYPRNTVEFRFFRGTLDYTTFIANIQFIRVLCEMAISLDRRSIEKIRWGDVLDYATMNDFTEFLKYCNTRKLLE